jgi:hypothetical protein
MKTPSMHQKLHHPVAILELAKQTLNNPATSTNRSRLATTVRRNSFYTSTNHQMTDAFIKQ